MKRLTWILLVLLLPFQLASANSSPPWRNGQLVSEIKGVEDIAIVKETLKLDLKPLANNQPFTVSAGYQLDNTGKAREVELLFITGMQEVSSAKCLLDGVELASTIEDLKELPESWKTPPDTPALQPGQKALRFPAVNAGGSKVIRYKVPFKEGKQTLSVSYKATAGATVKSNFPARFWQVAYILAPAKSWKSFGGLHLQISTPDGWSLASNVQLKNTTGLWEGIFDTLPSDHLTLTTQFLYEETSQSSQSLQPAIMIFLLMLAAGVFGFLTYKQGMKLRWAGKSLWSSLTGNILRALMLGVVVIPFYTFGWVITQFQKPIIPEGQGNWQHGYGGFFELVFLVVIIAPLVAMVGLIFFQCCAWLGYRKANPTI